MRLSDNYEQTTFLIVAIHYRRLAKHYRFRTSRHRSTTVARLYLLNFAGVWNHIKLRIWNMVWSSLVGSHI